MKNPKEILVNQNKCLLNFNDNEALRSDSNYKLTDLRLDLNYHLLDEVV